MEEDSIFLFKKDNLLLELLAEEDDNTQIPTADIQKIEVVLQSVYDKVIWKRFKYPLTDGFDEIKKVNDKFYLELTTIDAATAPTDKVLFQVNFKIDSVELSEGFRSITREAEVLIIKKTI